MKMHINIQLKENRWLLIAIVIGSFFNSFMSSSLNIAMPIIDNEYHVGIAKVAWISESFLLASAVGLMLAGWLADQIGRRKTFLVGNLIFGFISLFIYFVPGFYPAVILRFIQGLGSALIMASAPALIASAFDPSRRGFVLGIQTTFTYVGLSLAPLLGGALTQIFGWRSLFLFNFIFGLAALAIMFFGVKNEWKARERNKFDFGGYAIFLVAIVALVLALDWMNKFSIIMLILSIITGYIFIRFELKKKNHLFLSLF
jgi:MFS family permease